MDEKKAEWVEEMRRVADEAKAKAIAEEDQFTAWMNDRLPDEK